MSQSVLVSIGTARRTGRRPSDAQVAGRRVRRARIGGPSRNASMRSPTRSSWWSSGRTNRGRRADRALRRWGGGEPAGRSDTVGQSSRVGRDQAGRASASRRFGGLRSDADGQRRTAGTGGRGIRRPRRGEPLDAVNEPVGLRAVGDPDVVAETAVRRGQRTGPHDHAERRGEAAESDGIRAGQADPQREAALRLGPGPFGQPGRRAPPSARERRSAPAWRLRPRPRRAARTRAPRSPA